MPNGTDPPPVTLPQSVFNALTGLSYSPSNASFLDANNVPTYLFVESDANGAPRWFYGTNSEGAENPRGQIPSLTAEVINNGLYNSQTGAVAYNGANYKFRLERDAAGASIAKAYTV